MCLPHARRVQTWFAPSVRLALLDNSCPVHVLAVVLVSVRPAQPLLAQLDNSNLRLVQLLLTECAPTAQRRAPLGLSSLLPVHRQAMSFVPPVPPAQLGNIFRHLARVPAVGRALRARRPLAEADSIKALRVLLLPIVFARRVPRLPVRLGSIRVLRALVLLIVYAALAPPVLLDSISRQLVRALRTVCARPVPPRRVLQASTSLLHAQRLPIECAHLVSRVLVVRHCRAARERRLERVAQV